MDLGGSPENEGSLIVGIILFIVCMFVIIELSTWLAFGQPVINLTGWF